MGQELDKLNNCISRFKNESAAHAGYKYYYYYAKQKSKTQEEKCEAVETDSEKEVRKVRQGERNAVHLEKARMYADLPAAQKKKQDSLEKSLDKKDR